MGVTLDFVSAEPVPSSVRDAVIAASHRVDPEQPWLRCEPPNVSLDDDGERLSGFSKLNLMPDPGEKAEYDDPTKPHDLDVLIQILCDWSRQFGIDWHLEMMDEPFGEILGGKCPPEVSERIQAITALGDLDPGDFGLDV